jgi:pentatricopeptide repeat protein
MEHQGLQPDVQSYTSVIDCIARHGESPEHAEDMIKRMMKAGVRPDVVSYSAVINGMFHCLPRML